MDGMDTGLLLNPTNLKLQRQYFKEMCRLIGINAIYRAPRKDKHYNSHGELDSFFYGPVVVGCVYDEYPNQWTFKKLGWSTENMDGLSVIHVPYDLEGLQVGALFIMPSAIDGAKGRMFMVRKMSTSAIYPAAVSCQIGPVWESDFEPSQEVHSDDNFSLLMDDEEG